MVPTAAAGLVWNEGEIALARAASAAGIPFCIATGSIAAMERIVASCAGLLWFQLYMWHERVLSYELIERASTALLDRLLHHAIVIQIEGSSYRLRQHADLVPENARARHSINPPLQPKRRGRQEGKITIPKTADPRAPTDLVTQGKLEAHIRGKFRAH